MTYGHRPNSELLAYSGFVSSDEGFDNSVTLQLQLPKKNLELRKRGLRKDNIDGYICVVLKTHSQEFFSLAVDALFAGSPIWRFLRVFCADEGELKEILDGTMEDLSNLDVRVKAWIIRRCELLIMMIDRSAVCPKDESLVLAYNLSQQIKNVERRVLQSIVDCVQ
jgi:hypothetical protein